LKVTFLGTGTADSFERAQSSILFEKEFSILIDVGNGALLRLGQLNKKPCDIKAVLITHIHLDHTGDLLPLLKARWLSGVKEELIMFAPYGFKNWFQSQLESSPYLRGKLKYEIIEVGEEKFEVCGFKVESVTTKHSVESRGYIVDGVLVTGDTSPFKELYEKDFEVIIHELSLPSGFSTSHTTPDNLVQFSDVLENKVVYFTHIYSQTLERIDEVMEKIGFGKVVSDLEWFVRE